MLQKLSEKYGLKDEELKTELVRKNFTRAAHLGSSLKLGNSELQRIQQQAMGQMAAIYRNAKGVKALARKFGYSKKEVREIVEKYTDQMIEQGDTKPLKARYDYASGKYLTFERWLNQFIEKWRNL